MTTPMQDMISFLEEKGGIFVSNRALLTKAYELLENERSILKKLEDDKLSEKKIAYLRSVIENIISDWNERLAVERGFPIEELKKSPIEGMPDYYSPAGAIIKSELISAARVALKETK
jgi:hypothetical protein